MNEKFMKLMQTMNAKKKQSNPGVDDKQVAREEKERQLSIIDDKINKLEESEDPKALESLVFWKRKRQALIDN